LGELETVCDGLWAAAGEAGVREEASFVPMESLIYLMPRTEKGNIDGAICPKDVDMKALKGDRKWKGGGENLRLEVAQIEGVM